MTLLNERRNGRGSLLRDVDGAHVSVGGLLSGGKLPQQGAKSKDVTGNAARGSCKLLGRGPKEGPCNAALHQGCLAR